jgi:GNAT superfamily N-acetyltransferase
MTQNELVLRPPSHSDLPAIAALLTAEGFGDDNADRLCTAFDRLQTFSLVALRADRLAGVLLATFNGWHVFASHLVVAPSARGEGIGKLLIRALLRQAATAGAKGLIADSRLSAVGFFQKLDFRLPGAVFLIKGIQLDHDRKNSLKDRLDP